MQAQSLLIHLLTVLMMDTHDAIEQLIESTSNLSFSDRWISWQTHLTPSPTVPILERFNEYFPFNTSQWTKLAYI